MSSLSLPILSISIRKCHTILVEDVSKIGSIMFAQQVYCTKSWAIQVSSGSAYSDLLHAFKLLSYIAFVGYITVK